MNISFKFALMLDIHLSWADVVKGLDRGILEHKFPNEKALNDLEQDDIIKNEPLCSRLIDLPGYAVDSRAYYRLWLPTGGRHC
jgi:hypothetical protein